MKTIQSQRGVRIENIPDTGTQTGRYQIDYYGCWWEVISDKTKKPFWMIGEYPHQLDKYE